MYVRVLQHGPLRSEVALGVGKLSTCVYSWEVGDHTLAVSVTWVACLIIIVMIFTNNK